MSGLRNVRKPNAGKPSARRRSNCSSVMVNTTIEQIASQAGCRRGPRCLGGSATSRKRPAKSCTDADQRAITDTRSLIREIEDPVEALCH